MVSIWKQLNKQWGQIKKQSIKVTAADAQLSMLQMHTFSQ